MADEQLEEITKPKKKRKAEANTVVPLVQPAITAEQKKNKKPSSFYYWKR